jgi:5'-nucleotidase / UDP-sugar diphosphatase
MLAKRVIAGVVLALLVGIAPAQDAVRSVTILHINDLHAHMLPSGQGQGGFAQLAAAIHRERDNCRQCLLLNAGDLVQGTPVSTIFHGVPIYEISNLFHFDASTLGNHEFDYGWETAEQFLQVARYPVVCANVVDAGGRLMASRPYLILKTNGVRVAVIGALTDELDRLTTPKTRGPWWALPVVETVRRYIAELRSKSDVIVLLGHLTEREEHAVLESLPEVSVSITGHAHNGLSAAMEKDGRVVVRVKAYAEELGRLDLRVDTRQKKLLSWAWKRIPIEAGGPADAAVEREVKRWEAEVTKVVDTPIGESRKELHRHELKALVERAMVEVMKTDFAFINNGGLRDILPRGRLLARHIWNIMPFDNIVVVARVKGSKLPPVIVKGRHIDPQHVYTVASTDFTAANQTGPSQLGTGGLAFTTDGPLLRDLLIDWIKTKKVVGD